MPRNYTSFERNVIKSLSWQIEGFQRKEVPEDATKRILRASLRRISPVSLGQSIRIIADEPTDIDHCVPIAVVADLLLKADDITEEGLTKLLDRYLCSAILTKQEHRDSLREYHCTMPAGWDPDSLELGNSLARYRKVGIDLRKETEDLIQGPNAEGEAPRERFPLKVFRPWADMNDLSDYMRKIDELALLLPAQYESRASTFRRGKVIELLEQENLLEAFLSEHWPYGLTSRGRNEINSCKTFARRCSGELE